MNEERYLTLTQVAERYGFASGRAVRKAIDEGTLPLATVQLREKGVRRVAVEDLERFFSEKKRPATSGGADAQD